MDHRRGGRRRRRPRPQGLGRGGRRGRTGNIDHGRRGGLWRDRRDRRRNLPRRRRGGGASGLCGGLQRRQVHKGRVRHARAVSVHLARTDQSVVIQPGAPLAHPHFFQGFSRRQCPRRRQNRPYDQYGRNGVCIFHVFSVVKTCGACKFARTAGLDLNTLLQIISAETARRLRPANIFSPQLRRPANSYNTIAGCGRAASQRQSAPPKFLAGRTRKTCPP